MNNLEIPCNWILLAPLFKVGLPTAYTLYKAINTKWITLHYINKRSIRLSIITTMKDRKQIANFDTSYLNIERYKLLSSDKALQLFDTIVASSEESPETITIMLEMLATSMKQDITS